MLFCKWSLSVQCYPQTTDTHAKFKPLALVRDRMFAIYCVALPLILMLHERTHFLSAIFGPVCIILVS